ncbi:MAG: major outer membrane protein, partial [Gammaproteobacteria bacterium]|nr:major outer membrane protein [Gammaproteobacteria bacterium]
MKAVTMGKKIWSVAAVVLVASMASTVIAEEATLAEALKGGEVKIQFRYRYEDVDQDNALENANASTLKSRLNYTSAVFSGLQAQVEVDNVTQVGDDDYNSTSNNETGYSVVADPDGTEFNQAWLSWSGMDTVVKGGRQRILLDNERFVGGVGWRQNEQTYDSGSVVNKSLKDTTLSYAWVDNVNRVFGPDDGTSPAWLGDWNSSIHLLNASYAGLSFGTITVYDYLMDIKDADAQSNETWGVRFNGKHALGVTVSLLYTLEYARQEDYADNPVSYDADSYAVEGGLALPAAVTLMVGQEALEGDAGTPGKAFRTPLATLHKFQGFADMFLNTPDGGIQDSYVSASIVLMGATASAVWHDFEAEDGGASFGDEFDLSLSRKFGQYVTGLLKYADYSEDGFAVDTRKFW